MPAVLRKRDRPVAFGLAPLLPVVQPAVAFRAALVSRIAQVAVPRFWRHAAAAAGCLATDEFLCHIGRGISDALRTVAANAEAGRSQVAGLRATLHAAVDARCGQLHELVCASEATKSANLERELVAIDAALERWRTERRVAGDAAATLADAVIIAQHSALASRLDALDAELLAIPTGVVEPPHVGLADVCASGHRPLRACGFPSASYCGRRYAGGHAEPRTPRPYA